MPDRLSILERLVGAQLSAITFVMDYVQLAFDGSHARDGMSLYVWPVITLAGGLPKAFGDADYRDEFCALIGDRVLRVEESHAGGLVILLEQGTISVRPRASELSGPEIADFQSGSPDRRLMVWREGEPPFEELPD